MDERVLERMVARSGRNDTGSSALVLASGGVFLGSIFLGSPQSPSWGIGGCFGCRLLFVGIVFAPSHLTSHRPLGIVVPQRSLRSRATSSLRGF